MIRTHDRRMPPVTSALIDSQMRKGIGIRFHRTDLPNALKRQTKHLFKVTAPVVANVRDTQCATGVLIEYREKTWSFLIENLGDVRGFDTRNHAETRGHFRTVIIT